MITPLWATKLLEEVAKKEGKYRKMPMLTFELSKRYWVWTKDEHRYGIHGHFQGKSHYHMWDEIVIYVPFKLNPSDTFATDKFRETLLHEICHWLVPRPPRYWHDSKFYRKLFRLCQEYDIGYEDYKSEFEYMPRGAKKGFSQVYKVTWFDNKKPTF